MPLVVLYWCVYSFVITVSVISCRFMKSMYILAISMVFFCCSRYFTVLCCSFQGLYVANLFIVLFFV
jgi:hypothetical protein